MVNILIAKLLMSPVLAVYIIIPIVLALEFFFFFQTISPSSDFHHFI